MYVGVLGQGGQCLPRRIAASVLDIESPLPGPTHDSLSLSLSLSPRVLRECFFKHIDRGCLDAVMSALVQCAGGAAGAAQEAAGRTAVNEVSSQLEGKLTAAVREALGLSELEVLSALKREARTREPDPVLFELRSVASSGAHCSVAR